MSSNSAYALKKAAYAAAPTDPTDPSAIPTPKGEKDAAAFRGLAVHADMQAAWAALQANAAAGAAGPATTVPATSPAAV
jgi:hypothetical protein